MTVLRYTIWRVAITFFFKLDDLYWDYGGEWPRFESCMYLLGVRWRFLVPEHDKQTMPQTWAEFLEQTEWSGNTVL